MKKWKHGKCENEKACGFFFIQDFLWFLITKLLQVSGSDDDNLKKLWHIRHALKTKALLGVQIWEGVRGPGITCWLFTKWGGGKKITLTNPPYWLKYSKAKKCKFCWLPMIPSFPLDPNETNRQLYFVSSQVVSYSCLFVLFGSLFHFVFIVYSQICRHLVML